MTEDLWFYRWGDGYSVEIRLGPIPKTVGVAADWKGPFASEAAAMAAAEEVLWGELQRVREARRKLHRRITYVNRRDRANSEAA